MAWLARYVQGSEGTIPRWAGKALQVSRKPL